MAPAFPLYETNQAQHFHDPSTRSMNKARQFSRTYSSTFVADYEHGIERVGESEGLVSSVPITSADSSALKRKCINLNMDRCENFNVPTQVISISKVSASERKEVELRLRAQLEQIQLLQKKIESEAANGVAVSSTADGSLKKASLPGGNVHQLKRGHGGRFERKAPLAAGKSTSTMKLCSQLLNRLLQHPYAWVFKEPVDAIKLNIPDYYTIIKRPMDLGTIKSKLSMGAYASPVDFAEDVRLTFFNAKTYNPPGNDVHLMADAMSVKFESKWKLIEKKVPSGDVSKALNPFSQPKKRKAASLNQTPAGLVSGKTPKKDIQITKKKMTAAEKHKLSSRLESCVSVLPDPVIEFLKKNSGQQTNAADDEIEIDIDSLGDDTLFELKRLLDEFLPEAGDAKERMNVHHGEMEIMNESGLSNSSMQPAKGSDPLGDEEVDIIGNDKDAIQQIKSKCSSSSKSSSNSESSSDSDSDSSSESELHAANTSTPMDSMKGVVTASEAAFDQEKSDVMNPVDGCRSGGGLSGNTEQDSSSHQAKEVEEGENAPSERQVSPGKLYRAALLRSRFADTILKAREKALLDKAERGDPEKLQREREELERQQREERARLQAEARAAEEARRQAEAEAAAEAAAEAKRRRELEREAARQALLKIEKTVEIDENSRSLMDLEMLSSAPAIDLPVFVDEVVPDVAQDGGSAAGPFVNLGGSNPLEQLGLYMKVDDDDEDEPDSTSMDDDVDVDVEEGEID